MCLDCSHPLSRGLPGGRLDFEVRTCKTVHPGVRLMSGEFLPQLASLCASSRVCGSTGTRSRCTRVGIATKQTAKGDGDELSQPQSDSPPAASQLHDPEQCPQASRASSKVREPTVRL